MAAGQKRSLPRRVLRAAGWIFGGLVALVVVALLVLHSPTGQEWIRNRVEQRAGERLNGSLEIGSLELTIGGHLGLKQVRVRDHQGAEVITLESLIVDIEMSSLLGGDPHIERVALDGLSLALVQHEDGGSNLKQLLKPRPPEPPPAEPPKKRDLRITADDIRLSHIDVTIQKPDGTRIAIDDFGLQASLEAAPATQTVKLAVPEITAAVSLKKPKDGLTLAVTGIETGLEVALDRGAGSATLSPTKANAAIQQEGAPERSMALGLNAVRVDIEAGKLGASLHKLCLGALVLESLELKGGVSEGELEGEQVVQLLGLEVDARRLNQLLGKELLASDIAIETKISGPPERIEIDATVSTEGGKLALAGVVDASDRADPRYDIWLTGAELRSDKLVLSEEVPPTTLDRIHLGVRGHGISREDAELDVGLRLGPLGVGNYRLDDLLLQARIDGGVVTVEPLLVDAAGSKVFVRGSFDVVRKHVDAEITVDGDVGETLERLRQAGLDISTRLPRGALDLREGVITIGIEGDIEGMLTANVVINDAPVAGGFVAAKLEAKLERNLHPKPDDKKLALRALEGVVELEHINLKQALAIRGKELRGMTGTVSGRIVIKDAPHEPTVDYQLTARLQPTNRPGLELHRPTLVVSARGKGSKRDVTLSLDAVGVDGDNKTTLLTGKVSAPLLIGDGHRGISPHEPLDVEIHVAKRELEEFGPFLPASLLRIPNGTVEAHIKLQGTAARPKGTIEVAVEAPLVAGKTQKVALDGRIASDEAGRVSLTTDLGAWLDAAADPTVKGTARVELPRSPVLGPGPLEPSWALHADIGPQRLDELPLEIAHSLGLKGRASAKLDLRGNRSDALGAVQLELDKVKAAGKGPIDSRIALDIGTAKTHVDVGVKLSGTEVLALKGDVGRSGIGLLAAVRDKTPGKSTADKLGNPSLDLDLELPEHAVSAYAAVRPELAALPGNARGKIAIGGDLKTPTAKGDIAYTEFPTLSGAPGHVGVAVDAGREELGAAIRLGPERASQIVITAKAPRQELPRYLAAKKCFAEPKPKESCPEDVKLPIEAHIAADEVDIRSLVPTFAIDDQQLLAAGQLSWSLDGQVVLDPKPRFTDIGGEKKQLPPLAPETELAGRLAVTGGIVGIPGTKRKYHDVSIRLHHDAHTVSLDGISLRESDLERKDRKLDVSGRLTLSDWQPSKVKLELSADEWLLYGHDKVGPADAPRAKLSMKASVGGQLDRPVKEIDVKVAELELLIPDRFNRAHQPETVHLGDVIFLDETHRPKGKLPHIEPPKPPAPTPKPDGTERGLDLHVSIPNKIHVLQHPMNLYAVGAIDVKRRGESRLIEGKLEMVGGDLELGGRKHALQKGRIVFDAQHPGGRLDLLFGRREHNATLRDISRASGGERVTIHLEGPLDDRVTTLGGAGSPGTLYDLLSVHNAGRQRYVSQPDMPATNSPEFPQLNNLLMLSYFAVNAPNMLFLDKVAAWSDAYDDRGTSGYGQVRHYEAEGYNEDGDFRVRMEGRPRGAGQSAAEVQLDYLFHNTAQSAFGVGVSAGSRLGGGPGLFFEWSSKD